MPNAERFGSAYIVEAAGKRFLFDCGPAAVYKMSKLGVHPLDIDHLFFTHHHFDHMADFGTFLMTRWDHSTGSENRLNVFGPRNTEELTERLIGESGAFGFDLTARTKHHLSERMHSLRGGSLPRPWPDVNVRDIGPGLVTEDDGFRVTAAQTEHVQPYHDSLAYRLDTDEGSVVFTGDAQPCDHTVALAKGADALVSLCGNFQSKLKERDVERGQTGTLGAGELADEAGVKQLFLVHMSTDLTSQRKRALEEISSVYGGEITVTDEMETYDLAKPDRSGRRTRIVKSEEHSHIVRH